MLEGTFSDVTIQNICSFQNLKRSKYEFQYEEIYLILIAHRNRTKLADLDQTVFVTAVRLLFAFHSVLMSYIYGSID